MECFLANTAAVFVSTSQVVGSVSLSCRKSDARYATRRHTTGRGWSFYYNSARSVFVWLDSILMVDGTVVGPDQLDMTGKFAAHL